jgi:acetyl-CoA synthetase
MTRGLWGDPDRYLASYWSRFPGVWVHGDWASVDADGNWFLHGRSDDTLNVAGKRVGPAEYESALVGHPAVVEACVVGVPHAVKGETAWCYVVLVPGEAPVRGAAGRSRTAGRGGARCRPSARAGPVRDHAAPHPLGQDRPSGGARGGARADPGDVSTLEDPAALEAIRTAS